MTRLGETRVCLYCSEEFSSTDSRKLYCCPDHTQKASDLRRPDRDRGTRNPATWHTARNAKREAERNAPTRFKAIDGEAITGRCRVTGCPCTEFRARPGELETTRPSKLCVCGHEQLAAAKDFAGGHVHTYLLIGCADSHVENPGGLAYPEVFAYLYGLFVADPGAAYVTFFGEYDFHQLIATFPANKARSLVTDKGMRLRKFKKTQPSGYRGTYPVRLGSEAPGTPEAWEVDALGGKRLSIRPILCDCKYNEASRDHGGNPCPMVGVAWMHICDTGAFFQKSFQAVLEKEDEDVRSAAELAIVREGKKGRGTDRLDDQMRQYTAVEDRILERLMSKLDRALRALDIRIPKDNWYGPGAAVPEYFTNIGLPKRVELEEIVPFDVAQAAEASFTAGWTEVMMHGPIPGKVYAYDLASAYPSVMITLPCLIHGNWTHHKGRPPKLKDGQLRLVRCPPGGIKGSDPYIGATPHRNTDGGIIRPHVSGGWTWAHELEAGMRAGVVDTYKVAESWTFVQGCDCPPPLGGLNDLYHKRLSVGKNSPQGKALKLVLNSAYGKQVQGVGVRKFYNMVNGSLITAGTRCRILDAIATHPEGTEAVVLVATDNVTFITPHPGLPPEMVPGTDEPALGSWELTVHEDMSVFKPGFYWDKAGREALKAGKTPAFKARGIDGQRFAQHLLEVDEMWTAAADALRRGAATFAWPRTSYDTLYFLSPKQAIIRHMWAMAGQPLSTTVIQSADPTRKRTAPYFDETVGVIRTRPIEHGKSLESKGYEPKYVKDAFAEALDAGGVDDPEDTDTGGTRAKDMVTPEGPVDHLAAEMMYDHD